MLTVVSIRASITFAAGQSSEIGRYEVPREVSLPGLGIGMTMVPTGPGNREKSGNLTWVPPGPGKVRLFINTCSNPGKVRDFKVS